jgi:hypothetical protein
VVGGTLSLIVLVCKLRDIRFSKARRKHRPRNSPATATPSTIQVLTKSYERSPTGKRPTEILGLGHVSRMSEMFSSCPLAPPIERPIRTSLVQCARTTTRVADKGVPTSQISGACLGYAPAKADATAPICTEWPEGKESWGCPDFFTPRRFRPTMDRSGRSWSMTVFSAFGSITAAATVLARWPASAFRLGGPARESNQVAAIMAPKTLPSAAQVAARAQF